MLPPVLEIYIVHHPDELGGRDLAVQSFEHFHGTSFSGLLGGGIEVYTRAAAWASAGGPPRPIPFPGSPPPNGLASAAYVVVVPVVGVALLRAVQADEPWAEFIQTFVSAQARDPAHVGVFPLMLHPGTGEGTRLSRMLGPYQAIAAPSGLGDPEPATELRGRDLSQGIAQFMLGGHSRLEVFVSHTRRPAPAETDVDLLVRTVREIIRDTRLGEFFDASDLQPGRDWGPELLAHAATGAMLALRTDLYAGRNWCQREIVTAKQAGMPIVILDSLGRGEERGSFLMDHVPRIPVRDVGKSWSKADIRRGLNLLVDECLKRVVWDVQRRLAAGRPDTSDAWWAPHAPEPITFAHWLRTERAAGRRRPGPEDIRILHPDPPLGQEERKALDGIAKLMGVEGTVDVMTPRALAARGG